MFNCSINRENKMLIKDILTIDLTVDIKNVIDLEDISEAAIQSEIETYIITDGLAKEYEKFVSIFTSNILETGVWLSGFYGSGKSYFGKLLGYLISNKVILGTNARERILQRFTGINDEALIKNTIAKLNTVNARVVFMDIAKQDTSKGFSYALFRNFLKSLELPENEHGFLLYSLMCTAGYSNTTEFIKDKLSILWMDIKSDRTLYVKTIKELYITTGTSEGDYNNILTTIRREIDEFSASKLKDELSNYLKIKKDEKIVFLFDETSEAINQKKFTLLDLEGLSEALSSLGGKVWTIAIAQEKLDDIINNSTINKAQLTKVTDRFKTKIHLESTEVDVIIRSRLLKKTDDAIISLTNHFKNHSGKIADHSGLTGAAKTADIESYLSYYPFYQNQFILLQNFLFYKKGAVSTKIAARGMIITTYDVLKRQLQLGENFEVATGWQLNIEAQPTPEVRLVNMFEKAANILNVEQVDISGRHLMETINFLSEAEVAPPTLNNIVKSFIKTPDDFHTSQGVISKALNILEENKILLLTNGAYRITSDIEQRLLDEMKQFPVPPSKKKQQIITAFKNTTIIKNLSGITDSNTRYDFYITSDNDDELTNPSLKKLKIKIKSLYSFVEDRNVEIEKIQQVHQNDKDVIWLVPDNQLFNEIDKLLDEIERIKYLEGKYNNPNSDEGPIIRSFQSERSSKEIRFNELVEQSVQQGNSIYLYNKAQLDKNNWQSILNGLQRQVIHNVYFQRLASQLSDTIAEKIIKEVNRERLHTFFTSQGADFKFFDAKGNFIGDSLKPAELILFKIKNTFVDGITLEKELEQDPTGFGFGTVISTVSALMRGGKIMAKYNGDEKFSWKDDGVSNIFSVAREFRKASFKAIAKSISTSDKHIIVTTLQELDSQTHTKRKIDWNTNDFDLMNEVRDLAKVFCNKVETLKQSHKDFDILFSNIELCKDQLSSFTGAVSEANYIEKADNYLSQTKIYQDAISEIDKAENFIRNKLDKVRQWKLFSDGVTDELNKSSKDDTSLSLLIVTFNDLYKGEVVKNFTQLHHVIQKIKDAYFSLMQVTAADMASKYKQIQTEAEALIETIAKLPLGLNTEATLKTNNILQYSSNRIVANIDIEYDVKDKQTRFTYSEMLSFIDLYNSKKTELEIIYAGLVKLAPAPILAGEKPIISTKTYIATLPGKKLKVSVYKTWLQNELQKISGAAADDEIELN